MSEELEKKWHKLLKLLKEKGIITYNERDNLELESYQEEMRNNGWKS